MDGIDFFRMMRRYLASQKLMCMLFAVCILVEFGYALFKPKQSA